MAFECLLYMELYKFQQRIIRRHLRFPDHAIGFKRSFSPNVIGYEQILRNIRFGMPGFANAGFDLDKLNPIVGLAFDEMDFINSIHR